MRRSLQLSNNYGIKRRGIIISVCLILSITWIAFLPSLPNDFTNWDDQTYVAENARIKDLSWQSIRKIFASTHHGGYEPLTEFSFAVEYHFFGLNPRIYHATNLLFHLLNCLLVFWLVLLLSRKLEISFITALLFGVHPLHVESVAWISERKDVLYAFFFLGSLIAYLYYRRRNAVGYYYLSLSLFFVSLLPKPQGLSLPLVLLLIDYFLGRKFDRKALFEKTPFFILAILFAGLALVGQSSVGRIKSDALIAAIPNIPNAIYGVVFYLVKLGMPVNLSCLYPYTRGLLELWLAPFILAALITGVVLSGRYGKKVIFGSLFFLINIVLVLQVISTGPAIVADRYVYIPSIGIFYLGAEYLLWLSRGKTRHAIIARYFFPAALIVIISLLSLLTWQRCKVWQDSRTLWSDVLRKYENLPIAHNQLGAALFEKGNLGGAIFHYNETLKVEPDHAEAHNNLGVALAAQGKLTEAISHYNQALEFKPGYAEAFNNLGVALAKEGKVDQALFYYFKALEAKPDYAEAHCNIGTAMFLLAKVNEAISHYVEAIRINPAYPNAHNRLGLALAGQGKLDEATFHYSEALRIQPDYSEATRNLRIALRKMNKSD